jgi:hypothetical protein
MFQCEIKSFPTIKILQVLQRIVQRIKEIFLYILTLFSLHESHKNGFSFLSFQPTVNINMSVALYLLLLLNGSFLPFIRSLNPTTSSKQFFFQKCEECLINKCFQENGVVKANFHIIIETAI